MKPNHKSYLLGVLSSVCLFSLWQWSSLPAQAIPTGMAMNNNPFFSWAGQMMYSASTSPGSAPSNKDLIITDIILTTASFCGSDGYDVILTTSGGAQIGMFRLSSGYGNSSSHYVSNVIANLNSGLVLPAGETLTISNNTSYQSCRTNYTISGYMAQP